MSRFDDLLNADADLVAELIYATGISPVADAAEQVASALSLNVTQLLCALGCRSDLPELLDIVLCLGYESVEDFHKARNRLFVTDAYQSLTLKQVKRLQRQLLTDTSLSANYLATLFLKRAECVEKRIESTVKPHLIENYRQEMRTLYEHEALPIEFIHQRLENVDNGFRALIDEISLIVDAKRLSANELLHRHDVLSQEKRRLIKRGLVKQQEIKQRLLSDQLEEDERELLEQSLHEEN